MSIAAILSRSVAVPSGPSASQSATAATGGNAPAPTRELPGDQVVVSEQARTLASAAAGGAGGKAAPELQLSPEKLRQLISGDNG